MSAAPIPTESRAIDLELLECLSASIRNANPTITRIAAGMSGAGVYRVETGDQQFVLKITSHDEPLDAWRSKVRVQQSAADANIAPQVQHVDENRRAVLSDLIVDRSFPAQIGNPATREAAIKALGEMLRRLHELPIPEETASADGVGFLNSIWNALPENFAIPQFVRDAVNEIRSATLPYASTLVMSHNDVNPTNLVFDGSRVLLLDWQTSASNDPYYDLAAIAMFFRFDDATCRALITAHDGVSTEQLPDAFKFYRKFAAILSGAASLHVARLRGHKGGDVAIESTPSLSEVYQQLRSGAFDIASVNGQWTFGLALVKEGVNS